MNEAFRWNEWNEDHIASHGIWAGEAEYVINNAFRPYPEDIGGGKWMVRGQAPNGRYIQVVFIIETDCYYVIHARPLKENEKRQFRRRLR